MNPLFQEIIWLLTYLDYVEGWFVGGLIAPVHCEAVCTLLRFHSWSCSAAVQEVPFCSASWRWQCSSLRPCASPNREHSCEEGTRISLEYSWRLFMSPSSLFLLNTLHDVRKNRLKWRLIPNLLLWCCSEVRRITIKINTPPFLIPLEKETKGWDKRGWKQTLQTHDDLLSRKKHWCDW